LGKKLTEWRRERSEGSGGERKARDFSCTRGCEAERENSLKENGFDGRSEREREGVSWRSFVGENLRRIVFGKQIEGFVEDRKVESWWTRWDYELCSWGDFGGTSEIPLRLVVLIKSLCYRKLGGKGSFSSKVGRSGCSVENFVLKEELGLSECKYPVNEIGECFFWLILCVWDWWQEGDGTRWGWFCCRVWSVFYLSCVDACISI
jgi:hypothetical protein